MPNLSRADKAAKVSATEARRRKEVALARLRELEVAEKTRQLLSAAEVRSTWVAVAAKIRDAVLRIPDKLAPQVVAAKDAMEARAILAAECEAILKTLAGEVERAGF